MFAGETCEEGQFAGIVIKEEEDMQNLNSLLKEDEIARSHVNDRTQLGKSFTFQHIAKAESRGSLTHDDGQKQEEVGKDIKQPSEGLDEIEEQTIEIFPSHVKELEQQEDLVIESSSEIMRSSDFKTDKLFVNAGIA